MSTHNICFHAEIGYKHQYFLVEIKCLIRSYMCGVSVEGQLTTEGRR